MCSSRYFRFLRESDFSLKFIVVMSVVLYTQLKSTAQVNTLYLMHEVPQTLKMNPAIGYNCKSFIEMPVFSEIMLHAGNNLFSYNELVGFNSNEDNYFLNYQQIQNSAGINNRMYFSGNLTLLGGGMEWNQFYVSGDIGLKSFISIGVPRDFLRATDGNWDLQNNVPRDLDLSNTFLTTHVFTRLSLAMSANYNSAFRLGGRLSYLQGTANMRTKRSTILLNTEDDPLVLNVISNHEIQSSFPANIQRNNNDRITSVDLNGAFDNVIRDYMFNKNRGASLDVGMVYDYSENIQVTASVVDIGFVRWKSNVNTFTEAANFVFDGIDLTQYTADTDDSDIIEALQDSIRTNFTVDVMQDAHVSLLPVKTYIGMNLTLNEAFETGATIRADIHDRNIYPSLTLSLMYRPISSLRGVVSYSLMNRSYNNIGAGIVAGKKSMQFYIVTDIIPLRYARDKASGLIVPYNARSFNVQLGFNWIFNCSDPKKKYRSSKYQKICPAYN